jgi:hypothetical protein
MSEVAEKPKTIQRQAKVIDILKIRQVTFKGFKFALQARANENSRFAMSLVLVNPDSIVCTDGRRLHIFKMENDYEQGLYEVVLNSGSRILLLKSDTDTKFPDYKSITPSHKDYFKSFCCHEPEQSTAFVCACLGKKDIIANQKYVLPIMNIEETFDVFFKDCEHSIHFVSEKYEAVIMPLSKQEMNFLVK